MLLQPVNLSEKKKQGPGFSGPCLSSRPENVHGGTCWIELNKKIFFSNVSMIKKLIGPDVAIAVVLKSNAYGHGLLAIGSFCQEHEAINYLTVFLLSDAIQLRESGVTKPILVLGGYDLAVVDGIKHDVDLVVYDWYIAQEICSHALAMKKEVRVQVKVDTGLTRLGFLPEEVLSVVQYLSKNPFIVISGIYTHFAESDSQDTSFTYQQIERMNHVSKYLSQHGLTVSYVHMANTAAALRFSEARGNMIRCGGAFYGSYKDERFYKQAQQALPCFSLETCLELKARILSVRNIRVGAVVGYGRTFKASREMRLAIVAVGYYDGYDRRLSNKGKMLVHNKLAPIVGRVGMNMTTIDVTHIFEATVGDEVLVIGNYDGLRLKDIAVAMNVIEYEVMPPLNPALPRVVIGK